MQESCFADPENPSSGSYLKRDENGKKEGQEEKKCPEMFCIGFTDI